MEGITRGKLAKRGRVNSETIRFYEHEGLIPAPPRSASGYRQYPSSALGRLQFIKNAKALGFSLQEIRELLDLQVTPGTTCAEVLQKTKSKINAVDEKIRQLQEIRKGLVKVTHSCSTRGPFSECSILQFLGEGNL